MLCVKHSEEGFFRNHAPLIVRIRLVSVFDVVQVTSHSSFCHLAHHVWHRWPKVALDVFPLDDLWCWVHTVSLSLQMLGHWSEAIRKVELQRLLLLGDWLLLRSSC